MPSNGNPKYAVLKWADWQDLCSELPQDQQLEISALVVPDAVVIRQQDSFAPPALDAYANSISVAIELADPKAADTIVRLRGIADFFHEKAAEAWHMRRKLPD